VVVGAVIPPRRARRCLQSHCRSQGCP
jgi:hypothetical protein